jgi:hypothetical protein
MAKPEVVAWYTTEISGPFGIPQQPLRIRMIYANGKRRTMVAAFRDRAHLEGYIARFHPNLTRDKERTQDENFPLLSPLER